MDLIHNKDFWEAHDHLVQVNYYEKTIWHYKVKTWNLKIHKHKLLNRNYSNLFEKIEMSEFIWFEFIINFYSKFIYNFSAENYSYCNEYLMNIYQIYSPPFLTLFSKKTNGYYSTPCHTLLDDYNTKTDDFEINSISQMDLIIQNSINFLNYLDEVVYPEISFKTILKNNIDNNKVQEDFDLSNNGLASKYYYALKRKIDEII
jgi:hypothetical protein